MNCLGMFSCLKLFQQASISTRPIVAWIRVSTTEQHGEQQRQSILSYLAHQFPGQSYDVHFQTHSGFRDWNDLTLWDLLQRDTTVVVFRADRLFRSLEAYGRLVELMTRNRITLHIVGDRGDDGYVCSASQNLDRLHRDITLGYHESLAISERTRASAPARAIKRLERQREQDRKLSSLLTCMMYGSTIDVFNTFVNLVSPYGETDDRIGATHVLRYSDAGSDELKPVETIIPGDTFPTLGSVLTFLKEWKIVASTWTRLTLSETIERLFPRDDLLRFRDGQKFFDHLTELAALQEDEPQPGKIARL